MDLENDKDNKSSEDLPPVNDESQSNKKSEQESAPKTAHGTTESVAESLDRVRGLLSDETKQQPRFIALHVLGIDNLITFTDRYEITIGRFSSATKESPDIDLSGLPLDVSAISRRHLKLVNTKDQWYAEDLQSSNGTWLNDKPMVALQRQPLRDGDQLRVGTITILVSLRSEADVAESEPKLSNQKALSDTLRLTSSSITPSQQGLSTTFLSHNLLPYIETIIQIIQHVDRAKKRSLRDTSIVSIEFSYPTIRVRLSYPHEVLQFMQGLSASVQSVKQLPAGDAVTQAITPIDPASDAQSTQDSTTLTQRFMNEYLPLIAPDQSQYYQNLLMPLFGKCLDSELRIAV